MISGTKKILIIMLLAAIAVSFTVLRIKQHFDKKLANDKNNVSLLGSGENPLLSGGLKKFQSQDELQAFLNKLAKNGSSMNTMVKGEMAVDSSAAAPARAGSDFSNTNVQVQGVDEADISKTDGEYIYTVSYNNIFIVKADTLEQVAKINFTSQPQEFYLSGKKLIVFGYDQRMYAADMMRYSIMPQNQFSFLQVYDLSDIKSPKLVKDLSLEGNYFSSRLVGDYLYFTVNNYSFYNNGGPLWPRVMTDAKTELKINPDIYYFDRPYQSANFVTVASLDLNNLESFKSSIYLTNPSQTIYMSENYLYLADTAYQDSYELETRLTKEAVMPRLTQADRDKIAKIESLEADILSSWEKQSKIQQIIERYLATLKKEDLEIVNQEIAGKVKAAWPDFVSKYQQTFVYKIKADKGELSLVASANVPGRLLNQFSLDEYQGYLRLATTRDQVSSRFENLNEPVTNNLYVLDKDMKVTGRLEGLASKEQIYSARFMGERAYVVTFERVDPLLAIDLKDPSNPKLAGQLKLPGFSSYLHPYGEKYLIGLGTDTEDQGVNGIRTGGIKLSLFDVSDLTQPKELDSYVVGSSGSYSVASNDHKAFLFSAEKNLLAIPAVLTKKDYQTDFNGVLVLGITDNKFVLKGKLSEENAQRALYVADNFYTLSPNQLTSYALSDLHNLKSLKLAESNNYPVKEPMPMTVK